MPKFDISAFDFKGEAQRGLHAELVDSEERCALRVQFSADELLELFRRNREWNEQAARKQLVKLFEALGPTDPLTLSGRRRLSSLLFS